MILNWLKILHLIWLRGRCEFSRKITKRSKTKLMQSGKCVVLKCAWRSCLPSELCEIKPALCPLCLAVPFSKCQGCSEIFQKAIFYRNRIILSFGAITWLASFNPMVTGLKSVSSTLEDLKKKHCAVPYETLVFSSFGFNSTPNSLLYFPNFSPTAPPWRGPSVTTPWMLTVVW